MGVLLHGSLEGVVAQLVTGSQSIVNLVGLQQITPEIAQTLVVHPAPKALVSVVNDEKRKNKHRMILTTT